MSSSLKPTLKLTGAATMQRNFLCSIGSQSLHCSKTARLGIWEDDKFIGAIVFAWHSLLVSYADLNLRPGGKIYQASNWLFVGETGYGHHSERQLTHRRTISKYVTSDMDWLRKRIDPAG
jgi:hypothetical protein